MKTLIMVTVFAHTHEETKKKTSTSNTSEVKEDHTDHMNKLEFK